MCFFCIVSYAQIGLLLRVSCGERLADGNCEFWLMARINTLTSNLMELINMLWCVHVLGLCVESIIITFITFTLLGGRYVVRLSENWKLDNIIHGQGKEPVARRKKWKFYQSTDSERRLQSYIVTAAALGPEPPTFRFTTSHLSEISLATLSSVVLVLVLLLGNTLIAIANLANSKQVLVVSVTLFILCLVHFIW